MRPCCITSPLLLATAAGTYAWQCPANTFFRKRRIPATSKPFYDHRYRPHINLQMYPDDRRGNSNRNNNYNNSPRRRRLPRANRETVQFTQRLQQIANTRSKNRSAPARQVDNMLRTLLDDIDSDNVSSEQQNIQPNCFTYGIVISAWARSKSREGPQRAEAWLSEMAKRYALSGDSSVKPNAYIFCGVARAWAGSRIPGALDKADKLLQVLEGLRLETNDADLTPDSQTYTRLINAYSRSIPRYYNSFNDKGRVDIGSDEVGERAESLLRRMRYLHQQTGEDKIKPDKLVYCSIINCWGRSMSPNGAVRAEELLRKMEEVYETTGDEDVRPDAVSYTSLIKAWTATSSRENVERAESLLLALEERYRETGDIDLAPDSILYGTLLNAWASVGGREAAGRAETLLRRMVELYEDGNDALKPDVVPYTICMKAWCNAEDASDDTGTAAGIERAEAILKSMEERFIETEDWDIKPDDIAYSVVINAFANVGTEAAAERAEQLLEKMKKLYEEGDDEMRPTTIIVTACIKAWCNAEDASDDLVAERVDGLLTNAVELYEAGGGEDVRPNDITFSWATKAMERCNNSSALGRIEGLRKRLMTRKVSRS